MMQSVERRWKVFSVVVDDKPGLDRPALFEEEAWEYEQKLRQNRNFGQWRWRWNDDESVWHNGKPTNGQE